MKTENKTQNAFLVLFLFTMSLSASIIIFGSDKTEEKDNYSIHSKFDNLGNNFVELLERSSDRENGKSIFPPDSTDFQYIIDSLRLDSLRLDSLNMDSTRIDSTARLKNFRFIRTDNKYLEVSKKRNLSFYAYPSDRKVRRVVELDSTGNFVIIQELIGENQIRLPLKIPLEEYIKYKLENVTRTAWEKLGYKYTLKEGKDDLGQLMSDITNISIPLPNISILSIFGPPKIDLKINGGVDIHGAWRNETTEGITASLLGNTRNEPDFKQQVQINVKGTIGDKLTISADWNTERTFEYENQLKLHYTGYDDEIIQSIEAGNVSLQTAPLVGGGEALFGIKALFKFGPFSLTAIASQKKSEVEEVAVTGGSQSNEFEIHAYNYSTNHYFIDKDYASTTPDKNLFAKYYGNSNPVIVSEYRIKKLEVWKTTSGRVDVGTQRRGNAFIDLPPRISTEFPSENYTDQHKGNGGKPEPGKSIIGDRFVPLEEGIDYDYNPYAGFISFRSQINDEDAIAVAYTLEGANDSSDKYYGEFLDEISSDTSAAIVLKLIKPKNLKPDGDFAEAWSLQLKNIYPVGGRDVKKEGFKFDMNYQIPGQEPVNNFEGENLLEKFGLDITDESGTGGPDGAFDWDRGRTILTNTGEIIFPTLQPFGANFPFDQKFAYQAIYDKLLTFARQETAQDKFVFVGEYSALASSTYNIGFNVVENSVRVTLNGRELSVGPDYAVDYNIGQVIIRNEDALVTGANLKITYEKNDLFQLASKTLLGLRGVYDMNEKTKFGFSYLNLNQKTLSDKVRIGEEPLNNSIFGIDFTTGFDLPFITKGLDNIISTKTMSAFSLKGEAAYMSPDPNTKKSSIDSDNNNSIAYIDDFEGSKRTIPVGVNYGGWRDISVPDKIIGLENLSELEKMNNKGESYWFNILPSDVSVTDIWPDKLAARDAQQVTVLNFVFDPKERGTFNRYPDLSIRENNWGGIMRPLSSTASNLVEEHIEFIEFWMKINIAPPDAKLFLDIGQISEDIIPDGSIKVSKEDKNDNELLDEGEDKGLDGLTNAEEIIKFGNQFADPSNDDFRFQLGSGDYTKINRSEGNGVLSDIGRLPDTEDMNRNFTLDRVNSYFRYEIPLNTNRANNPFISGGGDNGGWYQIRIPLREAIDSIGRPSFTLVETMRLWVSGVNDTVSLRFAEMNLVGNQWQKVLVPGSVEEDDTTLVVSTINFEDNPEYTSPPGIERERDRSKPDEEVFKNEQSLQLVLTDLEDNDKREIIKYLFRPLDVFNYKEMKLFVHGNEDNGKDPFFNYVDENNFDAEMYFRFGTDTANYYEYRQPVKYGEISDQGWIEIAIVFEELTAIKQTRTDITQLSTIAVPGRPGHTYGVKGNPTLTKVNSFSFGVENPGDKGIEGEAVSGELWVNELRVLGADDTEGWAYSASSKINFADLMTVSVNASQTDPFFHKLNSRFGSRVDSRRWGASVNFDLIKLIPWNISGSNFNINYSRSESTSKPLYKPGTDINVDEAVKQESEKLEVEGFSKAEADKAAEEIRTSSETVKVSDTWSLSSIKLKLPSKSWYVQDIINNIQLGFSYNNSFSRSPSQIFAKNWSWNGTASYALNFGRNNYFYAADIPLFGKLLEVFADYKDVKIYFSPQSFNAGLSANRKQSSSQARTDSSVVRTQRDFTAKRNFSFNWKITEGGLINLSVVYNTNVSSSYAHLLAINDIGRSESDIWNDILNGAFFGKDYNYSQSFDVKTKPKLPTLWDIDKFLTITMGYNAGYNWKNNFTQADLGRSAGYSTRISGGITLKLQSLVAPLFKESKSSQNEVKKNTPPTSNRGRGRGRNKVKNIEEEPDDAGEEKEKNKDLDTVADSINVDNKPKIFTKAINFLKLASKWLFFDYKNITFNFNQTNSFSGSGIKSDGTGFTNFWGIANNKINGPSRLFMLGLSTDLGERAPKGNLSENFSQKNTVDFKTSRPLWEGAKIDINWKIAWNVNKTTRITTDEFGNVFINDVTSTGNIDRSFISLPILFSKTGILKVFEDYQADPDKNLSNAFATGFESFPLLSSLPIFKDLAKYVPRANWRLSWRGLEKIS
ncbi:MAG: cell surface protein SprA, partial [Ignavibacteriae bacterium]|nr:cell surface protein SprA [Ignavibacteriota bacterium]